MQSPPVVWSIAGFDPSSGAGVTADLMTFAAHGLFGCSAITALTVQSTMGAAAVHPVAADVLRQTLDCLLADLPPAGIKIGMLASPEICKVVAVFLRDRKRRSAEAGCHVVLDPVLRASSGRELYPSVALDVLHTDLLPLVGWITPNWTELGELTESSVQSTTEAQAAAIRLQKQHPHLQIVVTGGEQTHPTDLLVAHEGKVTEFAGEHVATRSTHGTGCAFSSSLLAQLVLGAEGVDAVGAAKAYVTGALRGAPGVGHGRGPLGLLWPFTRQD